MAVCEECEVDLPVVASDTDKLFCSENCSSNYYNPGIYEQNSINYRENKMSKVTIDVCLTPTNYKKLFNKEKNYSMEVVLDPYTQNHKRATLTVEIPEEAPRISRTEFRKAFQRQGYNDEYNTFKFMEKDLFGESKQNSNNHWRK